MSGKRYSKPADVWSLGVVFYHLLTFRRPIMAADLAMLLQRIRAGDVDVEPLVVCGHDYQLAVLASPMYLLHADPDERMSVPDLVAFLRDYCSHCASGLTPDKLDETHEDCRDAVAGLVEQWERRIANGSR